MKHSLREYIIQNKVIFYYVLETSTEDTYIHITFRNPLHTKQTSYIIIDLAWAVEGLHDLSTNNLYMIFKYILPHMTYKPYRKTNIKYTFFTTTKRYRSTTII